MKLEGEQGNSQKEIACERQNRGKEKKTERDEKPVGKNICWPKRRVKKGVPWRRRDWAGTRKTKKVEQKASVHQSPKS